MGATDLKAVLQAAAGAPRVARRRAAARGGPAWPSASLRAIHSLHCRDLIAVGCSSCLWRCMGSPECKRACAAQCGSARFSLIDRHAVAAASHVGERRASDGALAGGGAAPLQGPGTLNRAPRPAPQAEEVAAAAEEVAALAGGPPGAMQRCRRCQHAIRHPRRQQGIAAARLAVPSSCARRRRQRRRSRALAPPRLCCADRCGPLPAPLSLQWTMTT